MTTATPHWADSEQSDLLELVAMGSSTGDGDHEWDLWLSVLKSTARIGGGFVDPNALRARVRGEVAPKRCGAFVSRAIARDLIVPDGWVVSDDRAGKNCGKPARRYRWIGGAL